MGELLANCLQSGASLIHLGRREEGETNKKKPSNGTLRTPGSRVRFSQGTFMRVFFYVGGVGLFAYCALSACVIYLGSLPFLFLFFLLENGSCQ